jgi:hypothetical protein
MSTIESIPTPTTDVNSASASGQANGAPVASLPPTAIEGLQKYESVLGEVAKSSTDSKFKGELDAIENWFKVLNESERTAALYALFEYTSEDQLQFFTTVIQKKTQPQEGPKPTPLRDGQTKSRLGKLILRPPSLNIEEPQSPLTPTPNTATNLSIFEEVNKSTPLDPTKQETNTISGLAGINSQTLNMLANAGLSNEAQLLAAQLIMSGMVKPSGVLQQPLPKSKKATPSVNWRTPTRARYPASALRSSGLRPPPSALKSAALKSSGLDSATYMASPREEDFEPEMLNDIPAWLRGLRLHKYTQCFDGLTWEEIVALDDTTLEEKGIAALGARRRLLRTFEHVRKRMGLEEPSSATPTTSVMPKPAYEHDKAPHSAFPKSKLSINSPIFTPREATGPHSAVSTPVSEAPAVTEIPKAITPTVTAPAANNLAS